MFDFLLKLSSDFAQKSKQQHKITILANLFVSASIDAVLQNLNASEDIIQFFNDIQEPSIKGRVFSEFKKNPNLTADDLYQIYTNIFQEIENKQKKKLQSLPDTVIHAISIVSNPVIKIWIEKVVYKKFKDDLTSRNYEVDLPIIDQWANSIDKEELGNFNLENSNFDQVYDMVSRFIKEQQEGSASSEKKSGSLIYGPEWKNPQFNGYTIVELTEMPQLVYESECLGHCIGDSSDYFNKIKKQESRIFSLRDSSGKAIVTIETSYDLMSFKQIFGANNSQPNSWQIAMVNEWKNSLHPTEKLYEMAQDPSNAIKVAQFVSRGQHDDLIDMLLKSNDIRTEILGSHTYSEPTPILQALSQNINLNDKDYIEIYNKGKKSETIRFNLARNQAIPDNLYFELAEKASTRHDKSGVLGSFKAKELNYEQVNSLATTNDLLMQALDNPSISSNITRKLLENNHVNIIDNKEYGPKFINDYLSVNGYDNYEKFWNNLNNFKDEDLREIAKLKGIHYNKNNRNYIIEQIILNSSPTFKINLIHNDYLTPEMLAKLVNDESIEVRAYVAGNNTTPSKSLAQLANDKYEAVRTNVAENPNTTSEILAQLANSEENNIRYLVAKNPSTPSEVLARFANDEVFRIKLEVAKNPSTPSKVLAQLANSENENIRAEVAKNPNTPSKVLAQLANDKYEAVRTNVAVNPNTTPEILAQLANSENENIRAEVAKNPSTPLEVLARFANDEVFRIKLEVAKNTNTPSEILAQLANSENEDIRAEVAKNPSTPSKVLAQLANSEEYRVIFGVAENANTTPEILAQLANSEVNNVRYFVAKNPNTPPEILAQLANDTYAPARRAAENNPNTPRSN